MLALTTSTLPDTEYIVLGMVYGSHSNPSQDSGVTTAPIAPLEATEKKRLGKASQLGADGVIDVKLCVAANDGGITATFIGTAIKLGRTT